MRRGKGDSGGYERGGRQRNGPVISRPLTEEAGSEWDPCWKLALLGGLGALEVSALEEKKQIN